MIGKKSLLEDPIFQTLVAAISATVARLGNLRTSKAYEQANAEIEARLDELIGLKYDQIRYLDDDFILDLLTVNEILDIQRLWYLAVLIDARGQIQISQGNQKEGFANRLRALGLLIEVAFSTKEPIDEVDSKIHVNAKDLWESIPEEILFSLYDLWERRGAYSKALSALDHMLVISSERHEILRERQLFLQRLTRKGEEDLHQGNLTLAQVMSAIDQSPSTLTHL